MVISPFCKVPVAGKWENLQKRAEFLHYTTVRYCNINAGSYKATKLKFGEE